MVPWGILKLIMSGTQLTVESGFCWILQVSLINCLTYKFIIPTYVEKVYFYLLWLMRLSFTSPPIRAFSGSISRFVNCIYYFAIYSQGIYTSLQQGSLLLYKEIRISVVCLKIITSISHGLWWSILKSFLWKKTLSWSICFPFSMIGDTGCWLVRSYILYKKQVFSSSDVVIRACKKSRMSHKILWRISTFSTSLKSLYKISYFISTSLIMNTNTRLIHAYLWMF